MGKGLQIEERGVHLAFCAGTGVLVYLDLVGHLILRNSLPFIRHSTYDNRRSSLSYPQSSDFSLYRRPAYSTALPIHVDEEKTPERKSFGYQGYQGY